MKKIECKNLPAYILLTFISFFVCILNSFAQDFARQQFKDIKQQHSITNYKTDLSNRFLQNTFNSTSCSVSLPQDFVECNNSSVVVGSNNDYKPTYSTNDAGDTYLWTITGGPFNFSGGTDKFSRFPKINYGFGYVYNIVLEFTNSTGVCRDTQVVYRGVSIDAQIIKPVVRDTTIYNNPTSIDLSGLVVGPYNSVLWSSSGSGTFSSLTTLSSVYTFSEADKISGRVKIGFKAFARVNGSCNGDDTDYITVNIVPKSQLCQGSLGDPVVNITFGAGENFGPALGSAITNYTYLSSECPDNGEYAIANSTTLSCYTSAWHNLYEDHTPNDVKGYMMIVNASYEPGDFYVRKIEGLCSNTTYEFSAWIINLIKASYNSGNSIRPNITFQVEALNGTVLARTSTGDISPLDTILWKQYGATFTLPDTVSSIIIRMRNNAPGGNGNDLAIDDITFRTCGPMITATIDGYLTTKQLCSGDTSVSIVGKITSAYTNPFYQWQVSIDSGSSWKDIPGATNLTYIRPVTPPGTYVYRLGVASAKNIASSSCRAFSNIVTVIVNEKAFGKLKSDTVCAGINSGTLTLQNYTGTIRGWQYSSDSGRNWTAIANTTATQGYTNLATTVWYRAIVQSGACSPVYSDTAVITVKQPVTKTDAGQDRAICLQDSIQLSANTPNSGTGSWKQLSTTTAIITNSSQPNTTVTNLKAGIYSFEWTVSNGICADSKDTVVVTVSPFAVPGKVSKNDTVCAGINSGTLTLQNYTGTIRGWQYSSDSGRSWTAIANTTATQNYTNLANTVWYRTIVQSGACSPVYSDTAVITVMQPVTKANAGQDRVICLQDSIHLSANTPNSGTGSWKQLSTTTAIITNSSQSNTTVTNIKAGIYSFEWAVSNGICADSKDTVVVTVSPFAVPGKVSKNDTVCAGINSGTLTLQNYTGTIRGWQYSSDSGRSWTAIANTTATQNYTNLANTVWYRTIVQSGACSSVYSDTAVITVKQPVTKADAGHDRVICLQDTIHLSANTPNSSTGSWRQLSTTTAIITNANQPNTTVTNLKAGTYSFEWAVSNGICADSKDTIVVTVSPFAVPGKVSKNDTVCAGINSGTLTLQNYTGTIRGWQYSSDSGRSWTAIANTTPTQGYTHLANTGWYRTIVQSGACSPVYSDTAVITVKQPVTKADAGPDRAICLQDSIQLNANTPISGTGTWRQLSTTAAIINNSRQPNTSVTNLKAGTYSFEWTVSNGICADSKDTVQVTISPFAIPGKVSKNDTVCAGINSGTLTLENYTGTIRGWQYSSDSGSSWTAIANTTATQGYTNLANTVWYRTIVQSGACSPVYSDTAVITVKQPVTKANAGADRAICLQDSIQLSANTPNSGTGSWRQLSTTTAIITNSSQPNTTVTNLKAGTYSFEWTVSNGICADSKDTVVVTVSPFAVPGKVSKNDTVCAGINNGTLTLQNYTGTIRGWQYSSDSGSSWTAIGNTTATQGYTNLANTTWYRTIVQSGACSPVYSDTAVITVKQPVTKANAGQDRAICLQDTIQLSANTPNSGTGSWRQISTTTAIITNPNQPNTTVTNLKAGTYSFEWTVSNGICADSKDTVVVTVSPFAVPGKVSKNDTVCAGINSGTLTLQNYTGTIRGWQYSSDSGSSWTAIGNTTATQGYTNLANTTWYRTIVQSGACSPVYSDTAVITVKQPVTKANAGADRAICLQDSIHLSANIPNSGTGSWRQLSTTTAIITNSSQPNTTVTNLKAGIYSFEWTVSNGICADSKDTVVVTVSPFAVPGKVSKNDTVCAGINNGTLTLQNYTGTIRGWQYSSDSGKSWTAIANTTAKQNYTNLANTVWYRTIVQSGACSLVYSDTAVITVKQPVTKANAGADRAICLQDSIQLNANTP